MKSFLSSQLPDEVVIITDDKCAQAFLLAEGLLDKMPNKSGLAKDFSTEINTIIVCHKAHATHWVLACRFHDSPKESENGFFIKAWPKNKFPMDVVTQEVEKMNPENEKFDGIKNFKRDWRTPFS